MLVAFLRVLGDLGFLLAQLLHIVGKACTTPITLFLRRPGRQFHGAALVGDQAGPGPAIILVFRQHMPAKGRKLAGHRDGGDLMSAPRADADEEGAQRAGGLCRGPGRLDQNCPGVTASGLLIRPWWAAPRPDWRTRGFSPK